MSHKRINKQIMLESPDFAGREASVAVTVHVPDQPVSGNPVLFMCPGAGYARGYFDLQIPGFSGLSEAERHTKNGFVVVAIDHLGIGDSSRFTEGGAEYAEEQVASGQPALTLALMAAAVAETVSRVAYLLSDGSLDADVAPLGACPAVGVGQSMGGFVIVEAQVVHECFSAIALLGSSMTQTRLSLQPGRRYPLRDLPFAEIFARFRQDSDRDACYYSPETPTALIEADLRHADLPPWRSATIPACSAQLLKPGVIAHRAALVRVPVLLVYGEIDVTIDPLNDLMAFRSTMNISLLIVPEMAHMHNFAPTRERLWRRLESFAGDLVA